MRRGVARVSSSLIISSALWLRYRGRALRCETLRFPLSVQAAAIAVSLGLKVLPRRKEEIVVGDSMVLNDADTRCAAVNQPALKVAPGRCRRPRSCDVPPPPTIHPRPCKLSRIRSSCGAVALPHWIRILTQKTITLRASPTCQPRVARSDFARVACHPPHPPALCTSQLAVARVHGAASRPARRSQHPQRICLRARVEAQLCAGSFPKRRPCHRSRTASHVRLHRANAPAWCWCRRLPSL